MHDFDCRLTAADGRIVRLRNIIDVVVENDQPKELVAVAMDITEQKQTEEQLRNGEPLRMSFSARSTMRLLRSTGPEPL